MINVNFQQNSTTSGFCWQDENQRNGVIADLPSQMLNTLAIPVLNVFS